MTALLKASLVVVLGAYLLLAAVVYAFQRQIMYLPATERVRPSDVGLENVVEVSLTTAGGNELHSWHGRAAHGQPTLLFFHGNAGAVSDRSYRFQRLMSEGFGLFVLGYPGYGGSGGSPSEQAFVESARLAYEHLLATGVDADQIVIYGESIGSGVAVQLAASVDARALVLEAPMASAVDVAATHYPFLPARLLMRDTYYSVDYIGGIDMPLLLMHGDRDRIIPIESGRQLFEVAAEPKRFVALEGAGHNDLSLFPTVAVLREFIDGTRRD